MINKLKLFCLAWFIGVANNAGANQPPNIPKLYSKGPMSVLLSDTKLSAVEKTIYALYEATMSVSKELIHATSCTAAAGKYTFNVTTNGAIADPQNNEISIVSPGKTNGPFILRAAIDAPIQLRGQRILIEQIGNNLLGNTEISKFQANVLFNREGSIMTAENSADVRSINGVNDKYQSGIIKNLYLDADADTHILNSWGLQSLSKLDFAVEKYWLRSKVYRKDGIVERALFINDRILGATPCRIVLESTRLKDQNKILQNGMLIISTETPNDSSFDINLKPNS